MLNTSYIVASALTPQVGTCTTNGNDPNLPFTNNRTLGGNHDLAGNALKDGATDYLFDVENRIKTSTRIVGSVTTAVTYKYDGEGRRVRKEVSGGASTNFVYDAAGRLLAEYNSQAYPESGTRFRIPDHLGSTRLLFDASGTVQQRFDFLPFGEELLTSSRTTGLKYGLASPVKQRFSGQMRDAVTNLDYFNARYLSPHQGRFTSADAPLVDQHVGDPQSWNLYTYVGSNPLRYVDPTGRCSRDAQGGYWDQDDKGTYMFAGPCSDGEIGSDGDAPLGSMAQAFIREMNRRAGASRQMIGAVAVGSVAAGVTGGLAVHAGGAGLQQLGVAAGPAAYSVLPQIGRKLDYLFGLARGAIHNIQRSTRMLSELQRVGLNDTAQVRTYVQAHLGRVVNDASNIVSQTGGRTVRESFLMGPTGGVKLETVWEGTKLITMKVLGGGQ